MTTRERGVCRRMVEQYQALQAALETATPKQREKIITRMERLDHRARAKGYFTITDAADAVAAADAKAARAAEKAMRISIRVQEIYNALQNEEVGQTRRKEYDRLLEYYDKEARSLGYTGTYDLMEKVSVPE